MALASPAGALRRSLITGLGAGALAGLAASLVSLLLESPDGAFFNTASVTLGALIAGLAAGGLWGVLRNRVRPERTFALCLLGAFVLVAAGALTVERAPNAPLERVAAFVVPLAAIVFGMQLLLVPVLTRPVFRSARVAPAATVAALALGIALAGRGGGVSGRLALPAAPAPGQATAAPAGDGLLRPQDVAGVSFVIVAGESAASYTVREKVARLPLPSEAVGKTSALAGAIRLDGQPSKVTIDLRTLQSDQPRRDEFIRTRGGVQSEKYPFAEFTVANIANLPAEYRPGDTVTTNVTGTMKIREVERPLTFAVEARLQDNVLYIVGRTDFIWADFQIPPPNVANTIQVEDNVHIEVLLVARREGQG